MCADGLLCPPLPCSPEAVSPTEPGVCSLARQRVSKYWRSSCLLSSSPAGKLEACAATLRFSIGAGDLHSGPPGCTASILTTAQHQGLELSLHDNVPEKQVTNMGQLVNEAALKTLLIQDLNSRSLTRL